MLLIDRTLKFDVLDAFWALGVTAVVKPKLILFANLALEDHVLGCNGVTEDAIFAVFAWIVLVQPLNVVDSELFESVEDAIFDCCHELLLAVKLISGSWFMLFAGVSLHRRLLLGVAIASLSDCSALLSCRRLLDIRF